MPQPIGMDEQKEVQRTSGEQPQRSRLAAHHNHVYPFLFLTPVHKHTGVYYSTRAALGLSNTPFVWSPAIAFITTFVTLFAVVIAITKDLPDIEGDRAAGIETFATKVRTPACLTLLHGPAI